MERTGGKTACVIGAGVAGLATAKALREVGIDCTVHDRGAAIGGVWTDGYLNYGVQVPKALYEFPDFPMPADTPEFTPGPQVQAYLERYAAQYGLTGCIRLKSDVLRVEPAGEKWQVSVREGGAETEKTVDLVVVCVGLYSNIPHMPCIPGQEAFNGDIYHISDLKTAEPVSGKRVAVVGYGKSATDAALIAAEHAAEAHLIARSLHWPVPRKLAGVLPFKWGLLNRLTVTMIPLYKSPSAFERQVHRLGRPLVWLYWRVVEALLAVQCGLWSRFGTRTSLVPDEPAEVGAFSEATMVPRPALYRNIRHGGIAFHRATIERFEAGGAVLSDGARLGLDAVVFGTGWRSDYGFLPEDLQRTLGFEEDGVYLYRQILHPDAPGLAFVGYASTVSNILAYTMQANWLASLLAGRHQLPPRAEQLAEIELLKRWKRSWIPFSHARAARLIVHLQHYLDELLTDMGIDPLRKRGVFAPLAEVFAPYQATDYVGITALGEDGAKPS